MRIPKGEIELMLPVRKKPYTDAELQEMVRFIRSLPVDQRLSADLIGLLDCWLAQMFYSHWSTAPTIHFTVQQLTDALKDRFGSVDPSFTIDAKVTTNMLGCYFRHREQFDFRQWRLTMLRLPDGQFILQVARHPEHFWRMCLKAHELAVEPLNLETKNDQPQRQSA